MDDEAENPGPKVVEFEEKDTAGTPGGARSGGEGRWPAQ